MNNTMKFTIWFMAMMALMIGLTITTIPTVAAIYSTVRVEQSMVPQAGFTSTNYHHFWSALVAKVARSMKELPPVRVGRHYLAPEKSLMTLSDEHRGYYTKCVVSFDMVIIMSLTLILNKAIHRWTHLQGIVEAVETAKRDKRAKELAEAPKISTEKRITPQALASLIKEAKGEMACVSTATRISQECESEIIMAPTSAQPPAAIKAPTEPTVAASEPEAPASQCPALSTPPAPSTPETSIDGDDNDEFVCMEEEEEDKPVKQQKTTVTNNAEEDLGFALVSNELADVASFSNGEALELAHYASWAYLDLEANLGDSAYEVTRFHTPISSGYVRTSPGRVVITYKGTDTRADLLTDFQGLGSVCPELLPTGGQIHQGFLKAFRSTWPQILAVLEAHASRQGLAVADLRVTVCGHSLGAAQATLATLQMAHLVAAVDQVRLVTFGSPRVFSCAGAAYFDSLSLGARTLRVAENDVDPVTMVNLGIVGFKHVGINLRVEKPSTVLPHLMEGYIAGLYALNASTFTPTFNVGTRRAIFHACQGLLRFGR